MPTLIGVRCRMEFILRVSVLHCVGLEPLKMGRSEISPVGRFGGSRKAHLSATGCWYIDGAPVTYAFHDLHTAFSPRGGRRGRPA